MVYAMTLPERPEHLANLVVLIEINRRDAPEVPKVITQEDGGARVLIFAPEVVCQMIPALVKSCVLADAKPTVVATNVDAVSSSLVRIVLVVTRRRSARR